MKFILMMHTPRGDGRWAVPQWSPADIQAHMAFMHRLHKDLTDAGQLVSAEGLAPPNAARIVRADKGGAPEVTDGPFAESKEFLAGYWIVEVETPQQAYAIAARASTAPGVGGAPLNIAIEVREVMRAPASDQ